MRTVHVRELQPGDVPALASLLASLDLGLWAEGRDPSEGYVSELFVAPESRGRGIGGALLDSLETEARARGCTRLSLLNLRERESYRRGFYLKRGWTERSDAANLIKRLQP